MQQGFNEESNAHGYAMSLIMAVSHVHVGHVAVLHVVLIAPESALA